MALTWLEELGNDTTDPDVPSDTGLLTTVAVTANQVIKAAPGISAATGGKQNLYRVYAEVSGSNSAGVMIALAVDGAFSISSAGVITRFGTDTVTAGKGAVLTPTLSLQISGSAVNVCITPSSATSTTWKATMQTTKFEGSNP